MHVAPSIESSALLERYQVFLLDAYGVLVSTRGALTGAAEFLERIRQSGKHFLIITNDASRSAETISSRHARFGLTVKAEEVITSGSLLQRYFREHQLEGCPTIVLGTEESRDYVRIAKGEPVPFDSEEAEVVAVCDDAGFDLKLAVDDVITVLFRRTDRGLATRLVLPNPDLLYLRDEQAYGITSGSLALMIEAALELRYPSKRLRFERLGKPHHPMYQEALARAGNPDPKSVVVVGDQLVTDIRGARDFGLDSVLVGTGLTNLDEMEASSVQPTFIMPSVG